MFYYIDGLLHNDMSTNNICFGKKTKNEIQELLHRYGQTGITHYDYNCVNASDASLCTFTRSRHQNYTSFVNVLEEHFNIQKIDCDRLRNGAENIDFFINSNKSMEYIQHFIELYKKKLNIIFSPIIIKNSLATINIRNKLEYYD